MSLRLIQSLEQLPADQWDCLLDGSNPFVRHAFLLGVEQHICLKPRWGWTPHHAALYENDRLVAAAPAYLKGNSHGEFVFDRKPRLKHLLPTTRERDADRRALWRLCERITAPFVA
mgnify:CR=1 FL=1